VRNLENPVVNKSFSFAVRIVKCYKYLIKKDKYLISLNNQLLDSGTSIGAYISESQAAASKTDFRNKLRISLKEAYETELLAKKEFESLLYDCVELIKLPTSIIKNVKLKA
jgi:four helix bundle protein